MNETTRNLLVGIFVVTAFSALGILMVWFGEAPSWLTTSEWTLRISGVRDLSGVGEGAPVNFNGVGIGRVTGLEFADPTRPGQGSVIVTGIKREYIVPEGATARVYGSMIGLGTGRIEIIIDPAMQAQPLDREDASISGEMRSVIGEMVSKAMVDNLNRAVANIADLTAEWTPVGTNLAKFMEQRSIADVGQPGAQQQIMTANLSTVIERIDKLVSNVNKVLGDENVQDDVRVAVKDLKDTTEQLKGLVETWKSESLKLTDNINSGIDRTEANLDKSFGRLNHLLEDLDDGATSLSQVLLEVSQGRGTAGLIVSDERLYESAVLALDRFAEAAATLQRILGKIEEDGYVTIGQAPSGLLRKDFPIPSKTATQP